MATYSQNLVVIDPVTMGDQRTVGNRIFSEDERWLYRIEPGPPQLSLTTLGLPKRHPRRRPSPVTGGLNPMRWRLAPAPRPLRPESWEAWESAGR